MSKKEKQLKLCKKLELQEKNGINSDETFTELLMEMCDDGKPLPTVEEIQREELQAYVKNFNRILAADDPWGNLNLLIGDMDTLLKEYELTLEKDIPLMEKRKALAELEIKKLQVWLGITTEMICQIVGTPLPNLLEEEPEDYLNRAFEFTTSYHDLEEAAEFTFEKYYDIQNKFYGYFKDYLQNAIEKKDIPMLCYLANWMGLNFTFHSDRLAIMRLLNSAYKEKSAGPYEYDPIKLDE